MAKIRMDWFLALKQREQWMVLLCTVAVVLYVFYMFFLRPLHAENDSLRERNITAAQSLQWMKSSAAALKQQATASPVKPQNHQSIAQLLNPTASKYGLKFTRFQPRGNDKAQVWFESANFPQLFAWLQALEGQNVSANNVSISSTNQPGLVSASIQLLKSN